MIIERQKKLKELITKTNSKCLVLFPGVDFFYASGIATFPSERLTTFILPVDGDPILICPAFEKSRMEMGLQKGAIKTWQEDQDPFKLLGSIIKDLKYDSKQIALDNKLWFDWFLKIKKELPSSIFINSSEIIQKSRLVKSPDEIKIMSQATKIASSSILETFQEVKAGMTEIEVSHIVQEKFQREGSPAFAIVQSGPNSAIPHGSPTKRKIGENDVLLIDAGPIYKGYFGDITITSMLGKPNKKFLEIYEIVNKANTSAFKFAREGIIAEDLDKTARDVITQAGYGKYFTHRLGHGIGLEDHEPPYIVNGNKEVLKDGMCFTIEPGIYFEGQFGIRIEDDVFISKNKCEALYVVPRKIWEQL